MLLLHGLDHHGRCRRMDNIKDPWVISPFWTEQRYREVMNTINSLGKDDWAYEPGANRYIVAGKYFDKLSMFELDRARKEFDNENLLYTYSLIALYNQENSKLDPHYDDNACTYTFDICLYSEKPWPIVIEDKEYTLSKNEAVCFYGEDQYHWRPEFTPGNRVLMMFMHFADRDHWYFQPNKIGGIQ